MGREGGVDPVGGAAAGIRTRAVQLLTWTLKRLCHLYRDERLLSSLSLLSRTV